MKKHSRLLTCMLVLLSFGIQSVNACTGISLKSIDGSVVVARTVEWALGNASHDKIMVFPSNKTYRGLTPQGENGFRWKAKYGFISVTGYDQPYGPDGLNEVGLYVGVYYFPGNADFAPFDPNQFARSLSVGDFMQWMLSSFKTVAEVRAHLSEVTVVNVEDKRFGGAPLPLHWKISDPSGECIIIEIVQGGQVKVYDAFKGVITNSPSYDWHLTNLRNYLGLRLAPETSMKIDGFNFAPFGSGSGLVGMPGDFTPPSRFVRAAIFTASARSLSSADDAVFEAFRILDNFNIPVGVTNAPSAIAKDIEGGTQLTTVADLKNLTFYFHSMNNRQVRKIDLKKIDFSKVKQQVIEEGVARTQEVREITVKD